jgi:hypothetical protein
MKVRLTDQHEWIVWRFLPNLESDEYMNNANNMVVSDVNTIAHCDELIIPLPCRQRL